MRTRFAGREPRRQAATANKRMAPAKARVRRRADRRGDADRDILAAASGERIMENAADIVKTIALTSGIEYNFPA
jgi:hypothetical protein